jgi:hypothetical protein
LIRIGEFGPCTVDFYTGGDIRKGDFQPNRQAGFLCQFAVLSSDEGAAAKSDDGVGTRRNLLQIQTFEFSEVRFTLLSEDCGNVSVLMALDLLVQIGERPAELCRQAPADGAFAGAHETH